MSRPRDRKHQDISFGSRPSLPEHLMADPDDLLVVFNMVQASLYRQFKPSQVITYLTPWELRGRRPKRVFTTGLGISDQAWRFRGELELLAHKFGTEIYGIEQYDEVCGLAELQEAV
ncbi:hypothetical protein [Actinocorallia libanotica]|uniref:Uncharacterized protein n=1 Tax=Actinocorallia libanotica TaxID=46162 RepID=A0ABN1QRS7_9ACTN